MSTSVTIILYYTFSFVSRCYFYLPIMILWFLRSGFSQLQVMCLVSIFFISALVAELPTGIFADRHGRARAMAAGSITQVAGVLCLAASFSWWLAAIGEALLGLALAFHTGAKEAWLYDTLKEQGQESNYQRVYAKSKFFEFGAMSIGSVIGVPMYVLDGRWPFCASAVIFGIGALAALLLREPVRHQPLECRDVGAVRAGLREVWNGPLPLRLLVVYYAWFFSLVLIVAVTLSQPYLVWIGFPVQLFGWAYLFYNTCAMAGTLFADRCANRPLDRRFFIWLGTGFAGALLALACWKARFAFLLLGVVYVGWGLLLPTTSQAINRLVGSERRATILSVQDFLQSTIFVVTATTIGYATDQWGLPWALAILSGISLCVVVIFYFLKFAAMTKSENRK
ncbi:MAG: MFS transporter [Deltaproteobacteria bacterium]|nr:MFS transporter [Deltaproteobacteria bacterium]